MNLFEEAEKYPVCRTASKSHLDVGSGGTEGTTSRGKLEAALARKRPLAFSLSVPSPLASRPIFYYWRWLTFFLFFPESRWEERTSGTESKGATMLRE